MFFKQVMGSEERSLLNGMCRAIKSGLQIPRARGNLGCIALTVARRDLYGAQGPHLQVNIRSVNHQVDFRAVGDHLTREKGAILFRAKGFELKKSSFSRVTEQENNVSPMFLRPVQDEPVQTSKSQ